MRVLNGEPDHHDTASVLLLEIHTLCDFTSGNGKINGSSSYITGLSIFSEAILGFHDILLLYEQKLIFHKLVNDT